VIIYFIDTGTAAGGQMPHLEESFERRYYQHSLASWALIFCNKKISECELCFGTKTSYLWCYTPQEETWFF